MNAFVTLTATQLRLAGRNRMALVYGYLFPLIFLVAFAVIYRFDREPVLLHLGELLTVTVLGGACFGLPTALVAERERGVWRRYRMIPAPTWLFIASTLGARFVLLLTAAALQLALAFAIGMPFPAHPLALLVAFTATAAAFLALGMVIASIAGSVAAVQALGQCVFLPMLMIGGVAVRLSSLPDWALHLSAFFPGRYAVEAIQRAATGDGLAGSGFALAALLVMATAAGLATTWLFRWDARPRRLSSTAKAWLVAAIGLWSLAGVAAEQRGEALAPSASPTEEVVVSGDYLDSVPPRPGPTPATPIAAPTPTVEAAPTPSPSPSPTATAPVEDAPAWSKVGPTEYADVAFDKLPPDRGLVSPIAGPGDTPDAAVAARLDGVRAALAEWSPAKVDDPVQRVRNLLYIAAVPDVLQMDPLERHLPLLVLEHLRRETSDAKLAQLLYWVAMHPRDGDDDAVRGLEPLGLPAVSGPTRTVRTRAMLYAFKLLGRVTGAIKP